MQEQKNETNTTPSGIKLVLNASTQKLPSQQEIVAAMKTDIRARLADGSIPANVCSFSELHDYCDANCLGGVCDDEIYPHLVRLAGGYGADESMPAVLVDLLNAAMHEVDEWLNLSRPCDESPSDHPDAQTPIRRLICCCCGASIRGRQFHNQDTGYGLGTCCVEFVTPRVEDMARTYGVAGVHYFPQ